MYRRPDDVGCDVAAALVVDPKDVSAERLVPGETIQSAWLYIRRLRTESVQYTTWIRPRSLLGSSMQTILDSCSFLRLGPPMTSDCTDAG